ncbi:hypothetical protein B0I35DRAFT_479368 [Stachybotrys elegans]|uniref:Nitrogen regulatory protein areA GATA-like domain-containing protein n=1 Tax=Stachybotrys elegans TaxID=80388 RepID=A0A8K0SSU1_9HYPO|nr:hypothetical protein B0I35DRAFT_479368 [Stachybotrys elegans]
MDPNISMLLPKGIVVNTKNIYKEVADFPIVPADKVWKYWHVYTTTNKKLKDPTARRLENFWWHVWGSDRRRLSGRILARIYEDISDGPTFVPLRGPPNRWEGPEVSSLVRPAKEPQENEKKQWQESKEPSPPRKTNGTSLRTLSSSASKPPPPHPILKKARGPSSSGPRPTARFVSPHESADEDEKASEASSGSTATAGSEIRAPPVSPAKKKQVPATRKFVVSSTANKRRPLLPRRPSSQSSTNSANSGVSAVSTASAASDVNFREAVSSVGSRSSLNQNTVPHVSESTSRAAPRPGKSPSAERFRLSAKAAGKRPAFQRRATSDAKLETGSQSSLSPSESSLAARSPAGQLHQTRSLLHLSAQNNHESPDDSVSGSAIPETPPMMIRSQSLGGYGQPSDSSVAIARKQGLFTGATASMTTAQAQGTIIEQSGTGSLPVSHHMGRIDMNEEISRQPSTSSLLDSRMTPTQPSPATSMPLARTRSQLTLLLEREKSRSSEKSWIKK